VTSPNRCTTWMSRRPTASTRAQDLLADIRTDLDAFAGRVAALIPTVISSRDTACAATCWQLSGPIAAWAQAPWSFSMRCPTSEARARSRVHRPARRRQPSVRQDPAHRAGERPGADAGRTPRRRGIAHRPAVALWWFAGRGPLRRWSCSPRPPASGSSPDCVAGAPRGRSAPLPRGHPRRPHPPLLAWGIAATSRPGPTPPRVRPTRPPAPARPAADRYRARGGVKHTAHTG
jgi:hypothetical protein